MIRYVFSRLGCLIGLVGAILLVLGVAAVRSGQPALNYLLIGALLAVLGFALWQKLRKKEQRSTRFSLFRKRGGEEEDQVQEDNGWGEW